MVCNGYKKRWYAASIVGIYNEHYDVGWPRHLLSPQITLFNDNFIQNKFRGTDKAKTSEFLTHLFYSHPSTYQNGLVQTKGYPFFIVMIFFFWWRKSLWSMGTWVPWVPCGQADSHIFPFPIVGWYTTYHNLVIIINQDGFTANSCYHGGLFFKRPWKIIQNMSMGKKWLWRDHNLEMYWLSDFQLEHTYISYINIHIYILMSYKNLYSLYLCWNYFQKLSILRWNRCKHHHHDSDRNKRLHFSPKEADPPDTTSCSHECWICMNHWWI